jgi:hypothetical protein
MPLSLLDVIDIELPPLGLVVPWYICTLLGQLLARDQTRTDYQLFMNKDVLAPLSHSHSCTCICGRIAFLDPHFPAVSIDAIDELHGRM